MSFGSDYIDRGFLKNIVFKVFGWPSFLRRVQWWFISEFLPIGAECSVLDFGCGSGEIAVQIAKANVDFKVVGYDINDPNLSILPSNLEIYTNDSFFDTNLKFDIILLSSVLQMVPDPHSLMTTLRSRLNKGGKIILTVPCEYFLFANRRNRQLINRSFGVEGSGFFVEKDILDIFTLNGFELVFSGPSLDIFSSLVWEASLLFGLRLNKPLVVLLPISFIFFKLFKGWSLAPERVYVVKGV